jgi:FkbH-like protein
MSKIKISFLSNYITKSFSRFLKDYEIIHYDIGQIEITLIEEVDTDILIILLNNEYQELDLLKNFLTQFRTKNKTKILISNFWDNYLDISYSQYIDKFNNLQKKNIKLNTFIDDISDVNIINIFKLVQQYGINTLFNEKNKYLFQTPFTKDGFKIIADEIKVKVELFYIKRKKVLVLDADNTLWGGIIGEDGVDGIKCDENYPGILYKKFHQKLKQIQSSGIILTMVSKNNFKDMEELFNKRKFPLDFDDFLIKKINWQPKSQNIKQIAQKINVGLDSLLFIDDNPFEIEEVKDSIGVDGILINEENILAILDDIRLKSISITNEDKDKLNQYKSEQKRAEVFKDVSSIDDFIKSLNIKVTYWINNKSQLQRITQLINKTNQFNLTTKRYSQSEIEIFMNNDKIFSFQVEDKFGDMGIVSVIIVKDNKIDTFLMSCRVLGRKIEDQILNIVLKNVKMPLEGTYIKSTKNSQVEDLYEKLDFELIEQTEIEKKISKGIKMQELLKEAIQEINEELEVVEFENITDYTKIYENIDSVAVLDLVLEVEDRLQKNIVDIFKLQMIKQWI